MARIFKHPDLEDYFLSYDYTQSNSDTHVLPITTSYELGKTILLKNVSIDFDADFLESVRFPTSVNFKKFKSNRFLEDKSHSSAASLSILEECFDGDNERFDYFYQQAKSINNQISEVAKRLFPDYEILNPSITWRLNETINENLHVDVYNKDLPHHHLRIFVNLDTIPRIWHTSYTLDYLLKHKLHLLNTAFLRDASPGQVCYALNFAVFKGFEEAGREGCPKHIAFFEPGEVWLVDSRKVSHQIFYGRKALSTEFSISKTSMYEPRLHYFDLVNSYLDQGGV